MPVVPFAAQALGSGKAPSQAPPPESFQLMAAAQMHAEGRLVKKADDGK
jgi:hypothetical protein